MNEHPSLYAEIVAAGIPFASHESDLYLPATDEVRAILARWPTENANRTLFVNQAAPHNGERWFDVPFAFSPYWEAKQKPLKAKETALASNLNAYADLENLQTALVEGCYRIVLT